MTITPTTRMTKSLAGSRFSICHHGFDSVETPSLMSARFVHLVHVSVPGRQLTGYVVNVGDTPTDDGDALIRSFDGIASRLEARIHRCIRAAICEPTLTNRAVRVRQCRVIGV